jgi:hypothetical protein
MALSNLTPRQETAARLMRELQACGACVTNAMPLPDGQNLRFWVDDYKKNELLQQLKDGGYQFVFRGMAPQFCTSSQSLGLVNQFEVVLPAERQEIAPGNRIPKDEIGRRREAEIQKTYEMVYGKRR